MTHATAQNPNYPFLLSLFILLANLSLDIDECALDIDTCDAEAECLNIDGSYDCACKPGYSGDGHICTGNFYWIVKGKQY